MYTDNTSDLEKVFAGLLAKEAASTEMMEKEAAAYEQLAALEKMATAAAIDLVNLDYQQKLATAQMAEIIAMGYWNGFFNKMAQAEGGALATDGGDPSVTGAATTGYAGIASKKPNAQLPVPKVGANPDYLKLLKEDQRRRSNPAGMSTPHVLNTPLTKARMNIPTAPKAG